MQSGVLDEMQSEHHREEVICRPCTERGPLKAALVVYNISFRYGW